MGYKVSLKSQYCCVEEVRSKKGGGGTYFVGGRIGIAGTEGKKCSEIALAS